ncbi:dienelactone hydrolase [Paenibacillus rhizosphaerae]|uniref:Dienelactone hydrolase n=1 Tax=Paenibacillus rhizosphaerae TaxID=297318 RepID=A0A839TSI9_9BACL|nr:dienelactone hydrolase family protein [Paenibacillus rhizosphaerae]MBB3129463.1 dienelactone hydrolase [Paenibacillus rhizosphaerae]
MNFPTSRKTLVIILHEIYGLNEHILAFGDKVSRSGYEVLTPNLLIRGPFPYEQEEEAYSYFVNQIGFDRAVDEVNQIVRDHRDRYDCIMIVGFSIGATIAWRCSGSGIDGIIGYYGSRIRSYAEMEPKCPALLFFASNEKSFDVSELSEKLEHRRNTHVHVIEGEHGFMNPYSKSYFPQAYQACLEMSFNFLRRVAKREV